MSKNLNRITWAAQFQQASKDWQFVYDQLKDQVRTLPMSVNYGKDSTIKQIDRATRAMIEFAKAQGIEITLPDGWR